MLKKIEKTISEKKLFQKKNKIIVALSGGVDSMVLLHALNALGYNVSAAHCNFNLRGNESDDDEKFIKKICKKWKVNLFVKHFDTISHSKSKKISIQESARDKRYTWFNELILENNFDVVAVAHNANDTIETFLINIIRGSGIKGLASIPVKNNNIVRPLIQVKRSEIESYAMRFKIPFRNDSSNNSLKYLRNNIRLHLLPELKKLNRGIEDVILREIKYMQQTDTFIEMYIKSEFKKICVYEHNTMKINIEYLKESYAPELILFYLLNKFAFTPSTIEDIYFSLQSQSGKIFYSPTYTACKDRKFIVVSETGKNSNLETYIEESQKKINFPVRLTITKAKVPAHLSKNPNSAELDADKLIYPLKVRKWNAGDSFVPIGMKGNKKLSNFFIDQKISLIEKSEICVLESNGIIAWVIGFRISDKFKVTNSTKRIIKVMLKK